MVGANGGDATFVGRGRNIEHSHYLASDMAVTLLETICH